MDATDPKFADFAAQVSNDVSEDIDNRETRAQLREVIRFYAMQSCENAAWRKLAEDRVMMAKLAIQLLLPAIKGKRSRNMTFARSVAKIFLKD